MFILANVSHVWSNTIKYKNKKCILTYTKINEYNVEVAKQEEYITDEKIYIPSEISHNDTTYYVVGIAKNAFSGNKHIKEIIFDSSNNIEYIGESAFSGCENLTKIEIPSTVTEIQPYTFALCGLKNIEIHNLITKIGEKAFYNCTQLSQIYMGENVEEIENYAFAWCTNLKSFTIPEKTKYLGYEILQANRKLDTLYYNAINCPTSGAYYDNRIERTIGAFEQNYGLSEVIFGYKVERIPEYLLYNCHNIDSIYFPKSIKQIDRFALHNTEWFRSYPSDMIYVNNILYRYQGNKDTINSQDFKENTVSIASHCFHNNKQVKAITLPSNILKIYDHAFENCTNLTTITLPYDLEYIDDFAFKNCKNLLSIHFSNMLEHIGKYSFSNCTSITNVYLPYSIKTMGEGAFYNCENLKRTNIPDSLTYIVAGCFSNCSNLEYVKIHNKIVDIQEYAFAGCYQLDSVTIPRSCEKIGSRAFSNCKNLNFIDLKAKKVTIGPLAFYKCEQLPYIDLLGTYQIGYKAFANCENLRYISFNKELEIISNNAFENCNSLYSIDIFSNVKKIGKYAFANCANLSRVTIHNAKTEIGAYAFNKCRMLYKIDLGNNITQIGISAFRDCSNLEEIKIIHPIDKIPEYCFANCTNLKSISIPVGITIIDEKAFYKCENLTDINIPNTITQINEKAFYGCNKLTSIILPEKLEKLGQNAFSKCYNLTNIQFNAEECKSGKSVFEYTKQNTTLTIGNSVQIIDDNIFSGMNISDIVIPGSITSIGKKAFANSINLENISFSSKSNMEIENSAFDNTKWITKQTDSIIYLNDIALKFIGKNKPNKITFKEGTAVICSNFMKNNTQLEEVIFPTSLKTIGSSAFENCSNLKDVSFPPYISHIYENAFAQCSKLKKINIPASITKIDNFAFENCTEIDSINLNNAYCSIGVGAFRNCKNLVKINLGDNITNIDDMVFSYCTSLQNINSDNNQIILPSKIQTINSALFFACHNLKGNITLPNGITIIKERAFEDCKSLRSIEISSKLDTIFSSAFNKTNNFTDFKGNNKYYNTDKGLLYSQNMNILYQCPKGYRNTCVIHDSTKIVNSYAFLNCTKIQHVILDYVEEIRDNAFNGCINLKKISLGEHFYSLGNNRFDGCQNLEQINVKKENIYYKSVDGVLYSADMTTLILCPRAKKGEFKIPKSVQHIADYAFYNCNQITKVILPPNIKTIGKEAFTGCNVQ